MYRWHRSKLIVPAVLNFTRRAGIQEWWEATQALVTERTVLKEARKSQRLARAGAQR